MKLKPGYENEKVKILNEIKGLDRLEDLKKMVRIAGLEPARLAALPPQSSVSANSTISATGRNLNHAPARTQAEFMVQIPPQSKAIFPSCLRWKLA